MVRWNTPTGEKQMQLLSIISEMEEQLGLPISHVQAASVEKPSTVAPALLGRATQPTPMASLPMRRSHVARPQAHHHELPRNRALDGQQESLDRNPGPRQDGQNPAGEWHGALEHAHGREADGTAVDYQ